MEKEKKCRCKDSPAKKSRTILIKKVKTAISIPIRF
jgi:hypothetical protein